MAVEARALRGSKVLISTVLRFRKVTFRFTTVFGRILLLCVRILAYVLLLKKSYTVMATQVIAKSLKKIVRYAEAGYVLPS